jgi:hypothetical protein
LRSQHMRNILASVLVMALTSAACSESSPNAPAPAPLSVTGTWTGDLSLLDTPARMTWTLSQSGSAVSGPVLVLLPSGVVLMNGVLSGTLSGSVLGYTIAISRDGIPSQPACTGQLGGTATATMFVVSTLAGSYAVTASTCTTPFSSGTFTLTKQ